MKIITKKNIISILKYILIAGFVIFTASFLQFYWAMGQFSESISSSCLECWFAEDAIYMSLITAVFLAVIFKFLSLLKSKIFKMIIQFLLLISVWFFWDYSIFVDRESSWSTYLFKEELYYVALLSVLPILVLSFASLFIINYKNLIKR